MTVKFCPQVPLVTVLTIVMATFVPLAASKALGESNVQALPQTTPLSGGQTKAGGVESTMLTLCEQVTLLLQRSVACQVRMAVKALAQKPETLVTVPSTWRVTLVPLQTSLAVGESKFQAVPDSNVLLGGQLSAGGVVSTTRTLWLQLATLPQVSLACQVRMA